MDADGWSIDELRDDRDLDGTLACVDRDGADGGVLACAAERQW
jgi:hypothetical protein